MFFLQFFMLAINCQLSAKVLSSKALVLSSKKNATLSNRAFLYEL